MNSIETLKKRLAALAPADKNYQSHLNQTTATIGAIVLDVWPTFDEDNQDLLSDSGVARVFGDPRYREIERRVFAAMTKAPAAGNP